MPKRATHTFESEKDGVKEDDLGVQYCLTCGHSVLLLGAEPKLADLPRRRTDGAIVLERGVAQYRLKTKPTETKLLQRAGGCERQYRLGCANCGVLIAYRAESGEDAALTYLLADATGQAAELYLQTHAVPPCIQPSESGPGRTGSSVRVALDVLTGQPKRALRCVNDEHVGVSVTSPAKEGLANAELTDFMAKILGVTRPSLSLARGWSQTSKFLIVTGMKAQDVFKKLKAGVEVDSSLGHLGSGMEHEQGGAIAHPDDAAPAATAGSANSVARRTWEANEDVENPLAAPPSLKQQTFRA